MKRLLFRCAAHHQRWSAVIVAHKCARVIEGEWGLCASKLLVPDHLLDIVESPAPVLDGPVDSRPTAFKKGPLPCEIKCTHLVAFGRALFTRKILGEPGSGLEPKLFLIWSEVEVHRNPTIPDTPSESLVEGKPVSRREGFYG